MKYLDEFISLIKKTFHASTKLNIKGEVECDISHYRDYNASIVATLDTLFDLGVLNRDYSLSYNIIYDLDSGVAKYEIKAPNIPDLVFILKEY